MGLSSTGKPERIGDSDWNSSKTSNPPAVAGPHMGARIVGVVLPGSNGGQPNWDLAPMVQCTAAVLASLLCLKIMANHFFELWETNHALDVFESVIFVRVGGIGPGYRIRRAFARPICRLTRSRPTNGVVSNTSKDGRRITCKGNGVDVRRSYGDDRPDR